MKRSVSGICIKNTEKIPSEMLQTQEINIYETENIYEIQKHIRKGE